MYNTLSTISLTRPSAKMSLAHVGGLWCILALGIIINPILLSVLILLSGITLLNGLLLLGR